VSQASPRGANGKDIPLLKKIAGIAAGLIVTTMAACVFAIGARLGPDRSTGHNLYRAQQSVVPASVAAPVIPASYERSTAQSTDNSTGDDSEQEDADGVGDGPGATFEQVYLLLKHNFVDGIPDDSKLGHGAASAMIASLNDRNCRFLEQDEMREMQAEETGDYHGIGAVTTLRVVEHGDPKDKKNMAYEEFRLTVVAPLPGPPAEKAGLKPGDVITGINGKWIAAYSLEAAYAKQILAVEDDPVAYNKLVDKIQKQIDNSISLPAAEAALVHVTLPATPSPTSAAATAPAPLSSLLTLTVERPGVAQPLSIDVPADGDTTVAPVTGRALPSGIGYIHIVQFTADTPKALDATLSGLGSDLKGLIVDLRDTPGGLLDAAADTDGKLTGAPSLGVLETKGNHERQIAVTSKREVTCPIVVLVNGGTANTAELLAASLQSQGDKLVGQKTFGDGMDVADVTLRDGSGFTMTVGKYFTLLHTSFDGAGLTPDIAVPASATSDEQLNQAVIALSNRVADVPTVRG
jgi:carboxyl-terminal processing protease